MDERPPQPPEGKLISDALAKTGLSIRQASQRAGISYGRWRQITSGYQNVSPGSYAAVHAPAKTLARMAKAVGLTSEQLAGDGGRPDAARELVEIHRRRDDIDLHDGDGTWASFTPEEQRMATLFVETWRRSRAEEEQAGGEKGV